MSAADDEVIDAVFVTAFTTAGLVSGRCGHRHETIAEAFRCAMDFAFAAEQPYHDRHLYALTNDGELMLLDHEQSRELAQYLRQNEGFMDALESLGEEDR